MTIIPISCLSPAELRRLGCNVLAAVRDEREQMLDAVNRSLACHGERIEREQPVTPVVALPVKMATA